MSYLFGGEGRLQGQGDNCGTTPRTGGTGVGCLALGIGLLGWFLAIDPPSSRRVSVDWWETRLYEAAVFGLVAAVGVGLGLRAVRTGRRRWVGWAAVAVGGVLALRSAAQIARWL